MTKRKNFRGFMVYSILKKFPPVKIKVPASENYTPVAPKSKKEVIDGMQECLKMMEVWQKKIEHSTRSGKTMHPGFSYLNTEEWYQLIVMYWKHHLRQKEILNKAKQNL
ncbi:MAG: hypothetical protein LBI72_00655 [Flavobacteriaceae bacterium]|nr:hypothetical protein [Flavobacteriaceae bacterium]